MSRCTRRCKRVRKRCYSTERLAASHTIEGTIGATIVLFRSKESVRREGGRRTGTRVLTQLVALAVASTPAALTRHTDRDRACGATQHNRVKCHVAQRRARWLNQPVRYNRSSPPSFLVRNGTPPSDPFIFQPLFIQPGAQNQTPLKSERFCVLLISSSLNAITLFNVVYEACKFDP